MNMPDGASLGYLGLPLRGTLRNLPALSGGLSFPLGVWLCGVLPSLGDLPFPIRALLPTGSCLAL